MWDFRNKTNEQREKERERAKPRNRILTIENKLMVHGGLWAGGWEKQVMGTKA